MAQLRAVVQAMLAVFRARRIIRRVQPDVVLAGGGYVSTPVAFAAWTRSIPVVMTEADAHLGLANRMTMRVARRLCSAYPLPQFRTRQTVTGRPVEDRYLNVDRAASRKQLGIPDADRLLLVMGGSGGALQLNEAVWNAWSADSDPHIGAHKLHVIQLAGARDLPRYQGEPPASERYHLVEFTDNLPGMLAAADLVIARAGGSVFELAAASCPTVLVPSPNVTADHQRKNAEHFVRVGAALLEPDEGFDAARITAIAEQLLSPSGDAERQHLASNMGACARPTAARDIASIVEQLGEEHRYQQRRERRARGRAS